MIVTFFNNLGSSNLVQQHGHPRQSYTAYDSMSALQICYKDIAMFLITRNRYVEGMVIESCHASVMTHCKLTSETSILHLYLMCTLVGL